MTAKLRGQAWMPIAIVVGSLFAGAAYAWYVGEDANWDWQNYHEYIVWAAINGRGAIDVIPAGFQNYFNPLIYFPSYYLRHFLPPPYGGMIIGAVHGLNLVVVYYLARILLGSAANVGAIAAAILIAAVGPMTLSEVGTSFADILTAIPILIGVALILSAENVHRARYFLAGLLIGAMVGLKLTNVVFAVGAAASVLVATRPLIGMTCLALGGAVGGLATGGIWSLMVWRETANPVFPLFNGFFRSPELQLANLLDLQFIPRSFIDGLAYPIYWLLGDHRSSEFPFRDARFAVLLVLIPFAIALRPMRGVHVFARRDIQLIVLFIVSYCVWLTVFSIHRYAVVLELLCGPLIVLALFRIFSGISNSPSQIATRVSAVTLFVAGGVALWSQTGDWWRRPWSTSYRPEISEQLKLPATYFLLNKPTSYIAPLLPLQSRFYQLGDIALPIIPGGKFDRRIRAGLADPLPGGVWEIHDRNEVIQRKQLDNYGLTVDASKSCVEVESANPASGIEACLLIAPRK